MQYSINFKSSINNAVQKLLNGKIIIYPTDTLYGFGVDATNSIAIKVLNKLKKRKQKPYSIIVSSIDMLKDYCDLNNILEKDINNIFPGPFTAVLNKKKNNILSNLLTLDLKTIGIRIPDNKFIIDVVRSFNKPIITTSVNSHNEKPCNTLQSISNKYKGLDIFYSNKCNNSKGSTIIDFTTNPYTIIRKGDGKVII